MKRGRTVSQESLNGQSASGSVGHQQQLQHVERVNGFDETPTMSGIHMDMITSVVVERADVEKGGKGGMSRHGESSGMGEGGEKDLPVLMDPSGYLNSGGSVGEVKGKERRFGT